MQCCDPGVWGSYMDIYLLVRVEILEWRRVVVED